MNIMFPISHIEEIDIANQRGIKEIYFGLHNTSVMINNRRPSSKCNLSIDKETLEKIVKKTRQENISIYITVNSVVNNEKSVTSLIEVIQECIECGVTNFIVADINLIIAIRERITGDYNLTLSTCMPVYNQKTVDFFRKLAIKRFVLPRHLLIDEIDEIVSHNKDCEFEVIIKNSRCINEDGNCSYEHGLANYVSGMEGGCCQLQYKVEYVGNTPQNLFDREIIRKRYEYLRGDFLFACGACFLKHFNEIGIASLKIVGREFSTSRKIKDINFISKCISYIDSSEEEYRRQVRSIYKEIYGRECNSSQCYY